MRKLITILIIFMFSGLLFAKGIGDNVKSTDAKIAPPSGFPIEDTDLMFEDWESGINGWQTKDETSIPPQWHLDAWMANGGSGLSWWMADPTFGTNGGYDNSWYQVLDTDPITLSGTGASLTFFHRYAVESPGGEPTGYDGWDGINVRISTDGGTTWAVLTNPTPAYTATSLYSFGFAHGEGTGIPGWAGTMDTWSQVTFDLSAYDGQDVRIRFAFGSDPAYSTNDGAPDLFAWQVDDIMVTSSGGTLFSNDGVAAGMTASNNAATGADLWNIKVGTAFSGTHFADCNDPGTGTYVPNMQNSLASPYFNLPAGLTEIFLDFYLQGTWADNDVFPDVDFFGAYVQVEGESTRRFISNITQDPGGSNFVYSSGPATWQAFSATYTIGVVDLSSLAGNNIRVIFEFESDADAPIGEALQVEDVRVWTTQQVPVELTSFTAAQVGSTIKLEWNTATELNNHGFEIERKVVNENEESQWRVIGFKEGHGTMAEPTAYTYEDNIAGIHASKVVYRLKQIDFGGRYEYSDEVTVTSITPLAYGLEQNYPNPFNPATQISYAIPEANFVSLKIYNSVGEEIATLVNEVKTAGSYDVNFNASNISSGVYFYVLRVGNSDGSNAYTATKKMMLLK